jgi:AbrB family looped-hinge helix DNA binding protein
MVERIKVSSKNQIAVPSNARRKLQIQPGDYLLVDVRDGCIILVPEPASYSQHLRGLHRESWSDVDPVEYVRQERDAWQE